MMHRLSRVSLFALSVALLGACDGSTAAPPAPPGPTDPPPPVVETVPEGPSKSGSDVRLPWVITNGGARVKEGELVYAKALSDSYKQPVYCMFGPLADVAAVQLTCIPQYPSAVVDNVGNLYADSACTSRLIVESQSNRLCQKSPLLFGVLALPTQDACKRAVTLYELAATATPAATYVMQNGRCVADAAGRPGLNYFTLTRQLDPAELPQGKRAIE